MSRIPFLLYGANGYTGRLIAELAVKKGFRPILAGRNAEALKAMAQELGLDHRVIDLSQTNELDETLRQVELVIHAAGPFRYTTRPMVEACIRCGVHYIDINGDILCFELVKSYHDQAVKSRVMLLPGAGFDVVPTDCLALSLKKRLPDANRLRIAFASVGGSISHGTAMTTIGKLGQGGMVRSGGELTQRPLGEHVMEVDFGVRRLFVMSIPWGDVSTAFHTTGIPDIETFIAVPRRIYHWLKWQFAFNWLLRYEWVREIFRARVRKRPPGPNEQMRREGKSLIWAQVVNEKGEQVEGRMQGPEGYTFTAHACLAIISRISEGQWHEGYQTPAGMYGENLVFDIPGVQSIKGS